MIETTTRATAALAAVAPAITTIITTAQRRTRTNRFINSAENQGFVLVQAKTYK